MASPPTWSSLVGAAEAMMPDGVSALESSLRGASGLCSQGFLFPRSLLLQQGQWENLSPRSAGHEKSVSQQARALGVGASSDTPADSSLPLHSSSSEDIPFSRMLPGQEMESNPPGFSHTTTQTMLRPCEPHWTTSAIKLKAPNYRVPQKTFAAPCEQRISSHSKLRSTPCRPQSASSQTRSPLSASSQVQRPMSASSQVARPLSMTSQARHHLSGSSRQEPRSAWDADLAMDHETVGDRSKSNGHVNDEGDTPYKDCGFKQPRTRSAKKVTRPNTVLLCAGHSTGE
ncbi:MAG: hypothetical protein SGPRY_004229, partial [Prymnesium sp.]